MLQICCKNNNIIKSFPIGSSLLDIYNGFNLDIPYVTSNFSLNGSLKVDKVWRFTGEKRWQA